MFPIVLFGTVSIGFLLSGVAIAQYRRDFRGLWKGHTIHIIQYFSRVEVWIDKVLVHSESTNATIHFGHAFAVLGAQEFILRKDAITASFELQCGTDLIRLQQAPTTIFGNTDQKLLNTTTLKESPSLPQIEDPRIDSARRLYERIRSELLSRQASPDNQQVHLLDQMMQSLIEHVMVDQQLDASTQDYAALGSSTEAFEQVRSNNLQRITFILEGLQHLHLTVLQRNILGQQRFEEDLQQILLKLDAEIEVERISKTGSINHT